MKRYLFVLMFVVATVGLTPRALADRATEDEQLKAVSAAAYETKKLAGLQPDALAAARGRAKRQGSILILDLASHRQAVLMDHLDCSILINDSRCYGFIFVADLPSRHFFLVYKSLYEGGDYLLIDDRTGRRTILSAPPIFGPDDKHFLVIDNDETVGPHLEMWHRIGDRAVREWQRDYDLAPEMAMAKLIRWNGSQVELDIWSEYPEKHASATLRRDPSGWHFQVKGLSKR